MYGVLKTMQICNQVTNPLDIVIFSKFVVELVSSLALYLFLYSWLSSYILLLFFFLFHSGCSHA